jgi:hypothetical protein
MEDAQTEVKVEEKPVVVEKKKKEFVFTEKRVESLAKARLKRKENMTKKAVVPQDVSESEEEEEEEEKPKKKARVVTKEKEEEEQKESFTTTATRTAGLMFLAGATFYLQNMYGKQTKSAPPQAPTPPTQQAPMYQNNTVPVPNRQLVGGSGFYN